LGGRRKKLNGLHKKCTDQNRKTVVGGLNSNKRPKRNKNGSQQRDDVEKVRKKDIG